MKLQKILILILFIVILMPDFLLNGGVSDSTVAVSKCSVGLRTGLYLSSFNASNSYGGPHGYSLTYTNNNELMAGYHFGFYLDFRSRNHFSFQPEINYTRVRHSIYYSEWRSGYPVGSITITDYELTCSVLQLCLLPKLIIGDKSEVKILAGPFIRIPVASGDNWAMSRQNKIQGGIGTILGLRFDVPVKSDFVCIDLRAATDISSIISTPLPIKEASIALGLSYLFGVKVRQ
ncbi:MAG: hypothetical protein IPJ16_06660 [Bacteroidales bacterium]|nr:hypothetical protein [Bacteroidales bacterium]